MISVREVAMGRWPGILASFGVTEKQLSGKHTECPVCGGRDRFRFDDKDGRGTYFCSHCGAGDGIKLVMAMRGCDFRAAAQEVEAVAGVVKPGRQAKPEPDEATKIERAKRVWRESAPLTQGDEAMRYLAGRGLVLDAPPASLRLHPGLVYHDGERITGTFPAMVALVQAPDGSGVTLHRTYIKDGMKAPVPSPRKLMPGRQSTKSAIRLSRVVPCLGIAEGIETSLAASALFSVPVWSCINANGIETFEPPNGVEQITIFADNDESFTGQKAAYAAAFRLKQQGFLVKVRMPPMGWDWLDELNQRKA
ncbi:MAG: primase-helicase zinc-binding domain-containing protein [Gallionellaceae bacterium]|nr:primase-helicase zinc-binding domain-containing protein [Gallionellaceae bacterium]